jgi:hypothetical protein
LRRPTPGPASGDAAEREVFPYFDMQIRPFPGDDPFGPRRQPPVRPHPNDGTGKFGVDEVPFYEVIEFELPEGS